MLVPDRERQISALLDVVEAMPDRRRPRVWPWHDHLPIVRSIASGTLDRCRRRSGAAHHRVGGVRR
jgi:hypothetical protein